MWFTETPWPPIVGLLIIAGILFILWAQSSRGIYVGIILLIFLACGGTWYVEKIIITPKEEIEAVVQGIANACETNDIPSTLEFVSVNAPDLRSKISQGMGMAKVKSGITIRDVEIKMAAQNSRAVSHFRANGYLTVFNQEQYVATRWLATWQREDNRWKLIKAKRLHPIKNEEIDFRAASQ